MEIHQPNSLRSALYKKLVRGESIDDEDFRQIEANPVFCFNAVIGKNGNGLDVVACKCAREHEYFGHINNDGHIDPDGLDKICVWIDNGQCPHVENMAHDEDAHPTAVTAIHVAIAAKRQELYKDLPRNFAWRMMRDLTIFHLSNISLATIKQTYSYLEFSARFTAPLDININLEKPFFNAEQIYAPFHPDVIATQSNVLKLCIRRNDIQTLQCLLDLRPSSAFVKTVVSCSIYIGTEEITKTLLEYALKENSDYHCMIIGNDFPSVWTAQAILNDKPDILKLLKDHGQFAAKVCGFGARLDNVLDLAIMLGHERCVHFLNGFMTQTPDDVVKVNPFLVVLKHTQQTPNLCIRLLTRLCEIGHDINQTDYSGQTALMSILRNTGHVDAQVIEAMLNLGSDVDLKDTDGHSAIVNLLVGRYDLLVGRYDQTQIHDKLTLLLLCNPKLDESLIDACVKLAFRYDCSVVERKCLQTQLETEISHTPGGQCSESKSKFLLPLLWECGYPINDSLLQNFLVPDVLFPMLHHMICQPRPLKMLCRNRLRLTYPGAALKKFVLTFNCPWIIQDYISMTYLKTSRTDFSKASV